MPASDVQIAAVEALYAEMAASGLLPLWTQRVDLMPSSPRPAARPHVWRWADIHPLVVRAGELVPVGRGGERRAVALANPGLDAVPYATPTLWAAIQYLGPCETAPAHRHSQGAFRFVLEGQGVWTVVDGDPVEMRRGDLLLTPGWAWHEHHNTGDEPMTWLDGLDIPLVAQLDAGFFEYGPMEISDRSTPGVARSERLWRHGGIQPISSGAAMRHSPLMVYRWGNTNDALSAQLDLDDAGHAGAVGPGHAGIRFTSPTTGADALPTMRIEMHRLRAGCSTRARRTVGSTVWQVFSGSGTFVLNGQESAVGPGDLIAVPSWCRVKIIAETTFDLFSFGDAPVYEKLDLDQTFEEDDDT